MKFVNWLFADRHQYKSDPGSPYSPVFSPVVQEDGKIELVQKGQTCIYDEIQSYKDSVDVNRIIQRYANGDISALNARAAQFMDASNLPETYAEMLQVAIDAENFFSELPSDVKKAFDNNYYKFIASIGSPEFKAAFGLAEKAAEPVPVPVSDHKEGAEVDE